MRITKLARVKKLRLFDDFKWPTELNDYQFGQFNLIYGWNGVGKTTISTLFRQLESESVRGHEPLEKDAEYRFDCDNGTTLTRVDADEGNANVKVRVFNRKFIETVISKSQSSIEPIFQIGPENVRKAEELEKKEKEAAKLESTIHENRRESRELEGKVSELGHRIARNIKDTLRIHTPYRATNFISELDAVKADLEKHKLSDSEYGVELSKLDQQSKPLLDSKMMVDLIDLEDYSKRISEILSKRPIATTIKRLEDNSRLNIWVRDGLAIHSGEKGMACEFCGNTINEKRITELESHFSEEVEEVLKQADALKKEGEAALTVSVSKLNKAELYDEFVDEYSKSMELIEEGVERCQGSVKALVEKLKQKIAIPTQPIDLEIELPTIEITKEIERVNGLIAKQDEKTREFDKHKDRCINALKKHLVATSAGEYLEAKNKEKNKNEEIVTNSAEKNEADKDITRLKAELEDHQRILPGLNIILRDFLGREEIKFQAKEGGYQIVRDEHIAEHLSEGEKTAIAFSYFLMSLEDDSFNIDNDIIVIDDPISSLDTNAVYYAFSVIKQRLSSSNQLFVLTHNFPFFRQVKRWWSNNGKPKENTRLYQLRRHSNTTNLEELDKLLAKYDSEYHYLFKQLLESSNCTSTEASEYFHIPNVARRVLEAFMAYRKPQQSGNFEKSLRLLSHDSDSFKPVDSSTTGVHNSISEMERFTQVHSHNERIDDQGDDYIAILAKTPEILKNILKLIEETAPNHYLEMFKLCNS